MNFLMDERGFALPTTTKNIVKAFGRKQTNTEQRTFLDKYAKMITADLVKRYFENKGKPRIVDYLQKYRPSSVTQPNLISSPETMATGLGYTVDCMRRLKAKTIVHIINHLNNLDKFNITAHCVKQQVQFRLALLGTTNYGFKRKRKGSLEREYTVNNGLFKQKEFPLNKYVREI